MVRLSEAMARMHCSKEVQPKHVQEAFRLLNKSIIRVETPEINFEADEPQALPDGPDEGGEDVVNGHVTNGHVTNGITNGHDEDDDGGEGQKAVKPASKKIRVTYEQYRSISNVLILHLKRLEESIVEGKETCK